MNGGSDGVGGGGSWFNAVSAASALVCSAYERARVRLVTRFLLLLLLKLLLMFQPFLIARNKKSKNNFSCECFVFWHTS